MYVSVTVPIRACMGMDIVILSPGWWVDTLVDLYFIADLILNFFTAYDLPHPDPLETMHD